MAKKPSMFFSRDSWSHSAPNALLKLVTEESLVRNCGSGGLRGVFLGDADGVRAGFDGVETGASSNNSGLDKVDFEYKPWELRENWVCCESAISKLDRPSEISRVWSSNTGIGGRRDT